MRKEKKILIISICLVLALLAGILILIKSSFFKEYLMKRDLRKITNTFYDIYYDENNSDNNIKEFLSKYTETGLTVSLRDMQIIIENRTNGGTNYKTLEKCDIENTKVIIYPKEPFNKEDKELEFNLSCK